VLDKWRGCLTKQRREHSCIGVLPDRVAGGEEQAAPADLHAAVEVHVGSEVGDLKKPRGSYSNAAEIAVVYAALGDKRQAMAWLDKGYEERFNPGVLLRPGFDPLRADARFQDLERRVGLSR
jgi:hypothetical protein